MTYPTAVNIIEVSPRDGLQNEKAFVPTEHKIEFIKRLAKTGLKTIEATSFVSPEKIPQTADSAEVLAGIADINDIHFPVLVPNSEGFKRAVAAGAKHIAIFTAASNTFCEKNINCSIGESFARFEPVLRAAKSLDIPVRGYVSCVMGCPYEGAISADAVEQVANTLFAMGCYEISLGDTIGVGTPKQAEQLFTRVSRSIPIAKLGAHFHNTYGQALANLHAVLSLGVATIDASVAGLGGCPYAKGASGNVATEDVIYMLEGMGIKTGIDLDKLIAAGQYIGDILQKPSQSKVAIAKGGKP